MVVFTDIVKGLNIIHNNFIILTKKNEIKRRYKIYSL
jgi:hypothetical protein